MLALGLMDYMLKRTDLKYLILKSEVAVLNFMHRLSSLGGSVYAGCSLSPMLSKGLDSVFRK